MTLQSFAREQTRIPKKNESVLETRRMNSITEEFISA